MNAEEVVTGEGQGNVAGKEAFIVGKALQSRGQWALQGEAGR